MSSLLAWFERKLNPDANKFDALGKATTGIMTAGIGYGVVCLEIINKYPG
jgi:hypothetical protein